MPGWVFNVLLWVHRIEALLAIAHVTTIHFFIGHLRRHNFPMDLAMFEGSVDLEKARHERPAWVERMEQIATCIRPWSAVRQRLCVYYTTPAALQL